MKMRVLLSILGLLLPVLGIAQVAHADVNNFVITHMHVKYDLHADAPGGRMTISERIDLEFSDNNHGILRAIPKSYKNRSVKLKINDVRRDGQPEPYTTYGQNDNEVLKIGDAGRTITGRHSYEIEYEVSRVVGFYEEGAELYWDVNGTEWLQPFQNVTAEVRIPDSLTSPDGPQPLCFTGSYGSTANVCRIESHDGIYKIATLQALAPGENLSFVIALPGEMFVRPTWRDWVKDNWLQLAGLLIAPIAGFASYAVWRRNGKDYPGRGIIVPEYDAPKDLSPAEAGLIYDYSVDSRDLSATIIDLAIRGYIRIHDDQSKGLFGNTKHKISFELLQDDIHKLKSHEKRLIDGIFADKPVGEVVAVSGIDRIEMSRDVEHIRKGLAKKLTGDDPNKYFERDPHSIQTPMFILAFALVFSAFFIPIGWGFIVGRFVSALIIVVFALLMRRRTRLGVSTYEQLQGLRLYMSTADTDRLAKLQSVDRPYAPPSRTVELYEKLLPFAIALDVEKSWTRQFDSIYAAPPTWYAGNFSTFSMHHFSSALGSTVSASTRSFSAPSSSGSSGFSGGGSSGGGGGGGGGGGW